jgi:hypothetical protein
VATAEDVEHCTEHHELAHAEKSIWPLRLGMMGLISGAFARPFSGD